MPDTTTCPGCGVAVMLGYANCPRCHAPMPGSGRLKRSTQAGGTSLEPEMLGGPEPGRGPWLAIGAVVLLAIGIGAAVLATRGGDKKASPGEASDEPEGESGQPATGSGGDTPVLAPSSPTTPDPAFAAAALRKALAGSRVYATVEASGDVLEVRSSACDDAAVPAELARFAEQLKAAGLVSVRCREPNGADVFTRPL